jgi:hypothetical protein
MIVIDGLCLVSLCIMSSVLLFSRGVKPIEKKDGEGAHNWGNPTENPEDHIVSEYE